MKLRNIFIYRSDSDFDQTAPFYNPTSQTTGILVTDFYPRVNWNLTADKKVKVFYELEIGLNYWNQNNPDTRDMGSPSFFNWRNRELFIEAELFKDWFGFKVGYQLLEDPTQLFVRHYIGAAKLWLNPGFGKFYAVAGLYPSSTADIATLEQVGSLESSVALYALYGDFPIGRNFSIAGGLWTLHDATVYKKARTIWTPLVSFAGNFGNGDLKGGFILDAAGQFGVNRKNAYDGSDQEVQAFAAQAHGSMSYRDFKIDLNFLDLSPDGPADHSRRCTAFMYSDWNRSSMILLAQDKNNEWYDDIDAQISARQGQFWLTRPGYALVDIKAQYKVTPWFTPALAIGAAWILQPKAALGNSFVGNENDLYLNFELIPSKPGLLTFQLIGQIFVPGKAAAALINKINPYNTNNIYGVEAVLQAQL
jgi:hypothetical protein